jgi:hypothetical protein
MEGDWGFASFQGGLAEGHSLKVVGPAPNNVEQVLVNHTFWSDLKPDRYDAVYGGHSDGTYMYTFKEYDESGNEVCSTPMELTVSHLEPAKNVIHWTDKSGAAAGRISWHVEWEAVPGASKYYVCCVGEDADGDPTMFRMDPATETRLDVSNLDPLKLHPYAYSNRNVYIVALDAESQNASLSDPVDMVKKGDINGDDVVDMADAVAGLQVLVGLSPDSIELEADVDDDGKIGLAEVLFVLQVIAELR